MVLAVAMAWATGSNRGAAREGEMATVAMVAQRAKGTEMEVPAEVKATEMETADPAAVERATGVVAKAMAAMAMAKATEATAEVLATATATEVSEEEDKATAASGAEVEAQVDAMAAAQVDT